MTQKSNPAGSRITTHRFTRVTSSAPRPRSHSALVSRVLGVSPQLRGSGLTTSRTEQATTDYQARHRDRQVQDVVPIDPGGDGQQISETHKAHHGY